VALGLKSELLFVYVVKIISSKVDFYSVGMHCSTLINNYLHVQY